MLEIEGGGEGEGGSDVNRLSWNVPYFLVKIAQNVEFIDFKAQFLTELSIFSFQLKTNVWLSVVVIVT